MSEKYVLSYDVGTSVIKSVAISVTGHILGSAECSYETIFLSETHVEQRPEDYWQTVCRVTHLLFEQTEIDPMVCQGVIFCTQWTGIIPMDENGVPLHDCLIWMDKRASAQAERLNNRFGKGKFCDSDYWPKLMWLRENLPDVYDKCHVILGVNSYLKFRAAGTFTADVTDCFTTSPVEDRKTFFREILDFGNLDANKFPELCASSDIVGHVTESASKELGLCAGIPVFGGCDDIAGLAIGVGSCSLGQAHVYLGTSGWLSYVIPADAHSVTNAPLDNRNDIFFLGLGASIGPSTTWTLRALFPEYADMPVGEAWDILTEQMQQIEPGADRLLAAPWLFGGRPPLTSSAARGIFVNLNEKHTRLHMLTAMLEGICFMLRQNLDRLHNAYNPDLKELAVCGGGSRNPRWMQAMADILKLRIIVPKQAVFAGALGAAYCALDGLGELADYHQAGAKLVIDKVYEPNPAAFAEYDHLYDSFRILYQSLEPIFMNLNA